LSCNISEVMIVFAASVVNAPLPILPLQILFLNLVTDVFPALALGVGKGDSGIMQAKPRSSDEPILPKSCWLSILGYGVSLTFSVLVAFGLAFKMLDMDTDQAVTIFTLFGWDIETCRSGNRRVGSCTGGKFSDMSHWPTLEAMD